MESEQLWICGFVFFAALSLGLLVFSYLKERARQQDEAERRRRYEEYRQRFLEERGAVADDNGPDSDQEPSGSMNNH